MFSLGVPEPASDTAATARLKWSRGSSLAPSNPYYRSNSVVQPHTGGSEPEIFGRRINERLQVNRVC